MTSKLVDMALSRIKRVKTKDLGRSMKHLVRGSLGRSRATMPQIDDEADFTKFMKGRGITFAAATVPASQLKPTQRHFRTDKVKSILAKLRAGALDTRKSIWVARDQILDGHHRWAAYRALSPQTPVKVMRTETPIEEVLKMAKDYGARTAKFAASFLDEFQGIQQREKDDKNTQDAADSRQEKGPTLPKWWQEARMLRNMRARKSKLHYGDETGADL